MAKKRRSKKGEMPAGLKKYWASRRSNPRKTKRKSAKRRRSSGYTVGSAPVRRRKLNPRHSARKHHKRRRRHSNPRGLGLVRSLTAPLVPAAVGAGGALALDVVLGYLPLPVALKTGLPSKAVKLAGAVGLGMLATKFLGQKRGEQVAIGAMTVALHSVFAGLLSKFAPQVKTLGDLDIADELGYMAPGSVLEGTGAYLPDGVGEYMADYGSNEQGVSAYMDGMDQADDEMQD